MVSRYRVVVPWPLEEFADGLRRHLAGQGYALDTVTDHVHRLADLSGWLAGRGLTAADLTGEVAGQFLAERRAAGCRTGASARAFAPVLGYLREAGAAAGGIAGPGNRAGCAAGRLSALPGGRAELVGWHGQALPALRAVVPGRVARAAGSGTGRVVGRAGHRLCAGAGPAAGRVSAGPGGPARAAVAAALPARRGPYRAAAGRGGPGRAELEAGPAARCLA